MTSRADMWPAEADGARGGRRLIVALAVSLLCHALALTLARGWRSAARPIAPIVVTMLERGRGDEDAGAGATATVPAAPPVALAAPAVAPPPARAEPRTHPPAPPVPRRIAARPIHRAAEVATADVHGSENPALVPSDGAAIAGTGSAAAGAGTALAGTGRGSGHGAGEGSGADGLRAFCARCPTPDYPSRARRQGWQGTVDVALAIGGDGAVADARVERSSGFPALDDVALEVARRSRFTVPAGGDGLRGQLRYRFVLDATAARP